MRIKKRCVESQEVLPSLPRDLHTYILRFCDVRVAATFAMASRSVSEYMRNDEIWRIWMERDLKIVLKHAPSSIDIFKCGEGPVYKLYYLWYRFLMGVYQFNFIERICSQSFLGRNYPPDKCPIHYAGLNQLHFGNDIWNAYDFETQYIHRILSPSYRYELPKLYCISRVIGIDATVEKANRGLHALDYDIPPSSKYVQPQACIDMVVDFLCSRLVVHDPNVCELWYIQKVLLFLVHRIFPDREITHNGAYINLHFESIGRLPRFNGKLIIA